jgi:hypothetical protein
VRFNGKVAGWGIALATVAALATTGTVYAAADSPRAATSAASAQVLVPISEQPRASEVAGPMSLKDAVEAGAFGLPPGVTIVPASCFHYLQAVLGPLEELDGWVQQGQRATGGAFLQAVISVPGQDVGQLIEEIQVTASGCQGGRLTLTNPQTGQVMTGRVSFNPGGSIANVPAAAGFGGIWLASWDDVAQSRVTEVSFAADQETLLFVMEEEGVVGMADQLAAKMHERLLTIG